MTAAGRHPCPHGPDEWELLPGVREAVGRVRWGDGGVALGVASNQDHVGYGHLSERMARRLLTDMVVEATGHVPPAAAVQLCPHTLETPCDCRKPLPGMLQRIVWQHAVSSDETLFVGDADTDREAALQARVRFASPENFLTALRAARPRAARRHTRSARRVEENAQHRRRES